MLLKILNIIHLTLSSQFVYLFIFIKKKIFESVLDKRTDIYIEFSLVQLQVIFIHKLPIYKYIFFSDWIRYFKAKHVIFVLPENN